jgi:NAD(P)-dependent dehydrogenase (short-subunit alcohol dehydrogenase family)
MHPWALVSPGSRGIGLHLARHLVQNTKLPIVTTARKDLEEVKHSILHGLHQVDPKRVKVLELDVLGMYMHPTCESVMLMSDGRQTSLQFRRQHPLVKTCSQAKTITCM